MISVSLNRTKNWCEVKSNYNVYFFKSFVRFQLNSVIRNGRLPSKKSPKVFDFHPEFWYIDKQPKLDEGQQPQQQQQQQQSFLSFSQWGSDNFFLAGGLPIQVLADQFIKIYYKQCKS